ncbi:MAG TPA: TIGR02206 family membrane protein [Pseudogracilibacillus sp.]|nr:TIGR02206 family membrane protein [Pseudogracilibacillus sp.]
MTFWYNPTNRFMMFSSEHYTMLISCLILLGIVFLFRKKLSHYRLQINYVFGAYFLISNLLLVIWYVTTDNWSWKHSLPIELCTISALLVGLICLSGKTKLMPYVYFFAVAGAIQAMVTPDLLYGIHNFRFWQFFIDHSLLIIAPITVIVLNGMKLTYNHFISSFIILNIIALLVFGINWLIDANYMFLRYKPSGQSLLDYLGSYPYYILSLEVVALIFYILLFMPLKQKSSRS